MHKIRRFLLLVCALPVLCVLAICLVPERWIANRIESAASLSLGADLRIGSLHLNRLSWEPSARFSNVTLNGPEQNEILDIGRLFTSITLKQLLRGKLLFEKVEIVDSTIALSIDEAGTGSWDFLLTDSATDNSSVEATDTEEVEVSANPDNQSIYIPAILALKVENLNIRLDDKLAERSAKLVVSASGSTALSEEPAIVNIGGDVNGESVEVDAMFTTNAPLVIPPETMDVDVSASLGGSTVDVSGKLEQLGTLGVMDLDIAIDANGLRELDNVVGLGLPQVPSFSIKGGLIREENFIVLRRFDGALGNTTLEGDVRVDYTTTPITLFANIISSELDFNDLTGLIGATPDRETDGGESTDQFDNGRLLPNRPIDLLPLTRLFNGAIDYRADSVKSQQLPISRLDMRAEIDGLTMAVSPISVDVAGGIISGSVNFDVSNETPQGVFELEVNRVNLRDLLKSSGIDDDSFGVIGGRLKFWASGATVGEMGASLDGGVFLLMTQGQLDALLSEAAGLDVFESLALLIDPEKSLTEIRCAYLDMHTTSGVMDISTLVIDTDDTVFLADGSVDLNDETLDLKLEPHPKDLSILAARTAIDIEGTLSDPSITPGKALALRSAAAAALSVLGTPVLGLLPFIEAGTAEDSNYCSGLVGSLGDAENGAEPVVETDIDTDNEIE